MPVRPTSQIRIRIERRPPTVSPPPIAELRILAGRLAERAARRNPRRQWMELDVVLLGDAGMAAANRQCLGHEGITDVISLAYQPMSGASGWRGEVLVNLDLAHRLGPRYGGAGRELALYVAHGLNHLSDAHDHTPALRARMRRRERRWLRAAFEAGGLAELERWGRTRGAPCKPPRKARRC